MSSRNPRNPVARFMPRKGGAHGKSRKAERRRDKAALARAPADA